jgi:hypothetical protein
LAEPEYEERYPLIKKMLPFTTALVVIVLLYVGWIVYTRWKANHVDKQQVAAEEQANARKTVEAYGGNQVKILQMSLTPPVIGKGEQSMVCYGVFNAKNVKIEPKPDAEVWPSTNRCVHVTATRTTNVTITADDGAGHSETKSLLLQVAARE